MLTRDFNMNAIIDKTNDIKMSIGDIYGNTKEALTKKYSVNDLTKNIIPDDPEIQKRIQSFCSSNRYSKGSGDWLGNLNRNINGEGTLNLCADGKRMMGEGDTLISIASKLRGGASFDPSGMIGNFATRELSSLGINNVPSCLTDSLFNSLKGVLSLPGGLIPKLDLSRLLNNSCLKDTLNFGVNNIDNVMKATTLQTMADQNEDKVIKSYVFKNYENDPKGISSALEGNVSKVNGSNTIKQLSLIEDNYAGSVDKGNLLGNVDKEINSSNSPVFKKLDNYYSGEDASYFKGKTNISNSANSYLTSLKSSDSLSSNQKTTNLNSASLSMIANAFA